MPSGNYMRIKFLDRVYGDRVRVYIYDKYNELIFDKTYDYGLNASYSRENAAKAAKDYAMAIENKWPTNSYYNLKPFIGDILVDLIDAFNIKDDDITYAGFHCFTKTPYTDEEIAKTLDDIVKEI